MNEVTSVILGVFNIALLNIILSCDNISVIALITCELPARFAKKAYVIGIIAAVILTIFFTSFISFIMEIQWLPIQLIGGLLLVKITIDLIKSKGYDDKGQVCHNPEEKYTKFWSAVINIIIADIALSMDNVLAIAGAADGNIMVIAFGLIVSLPFILFASQYVVKLMRKNRLVLYISGAILAYTALEMILSYRFISPFIPKILISSFPLLTSSFILLYGIYTVSGKAPV